MTQRLRLFAYVMAVLCNLQSLPSAIAQSGNSTVAGTAKDSAGSLLHGARVELEPGGKQAVTDNQGQFRFTEVPAGDYTLSVSYVGFQPFSKSVKVQSNEVTGVEAVLQVASRTEQVLVTAERVQGEAEAINTRDGGIQKRSMQVPADNLASAAHHPPSQALIHQNDVECLPFSRPMTLG